MTVGARGVFHHRSGPRLPAGRIEPLTPEHDELGDPANGERVTRCWNCGRPALGRRIYEFGLVLNGHVMGHWRLCAGCFVERNPQPDPDPLDVTEAA